MKYIWQFNLTTLLKALPASNRGKRDLLILTLMIPIHPVYYRIYICRNFFWTKNNHPSIRLKRDLLILTLMIPIHPLDQNIYPLDWNRIQIFWETLLAKKISIHILDQNKIKIFWETFLAKNIYPSIRPK